MNKKGFTLVELLAVIVILALLALLTSTAVTKLVKDAKEDLSETQIQLIKSAADTWIADNLNNLPSSGDCGYLTLEDLKYYGLLDNTILDPKNSEEIPNDLKIKITTHASAYGNPVTNAEVNPESIEGCSQIYFPICTIATDSTVEGLNMGAKYSCKVDPNKDPYTFFVLTSAGADSSTVNMIMDSNINITGEAVKSNSIEDKGYVAWINKIDYLSPQIGGSEAEWDEAGVDYGNWNKGPITAMNYLQTATSNWTNLNSTKVDTFTVCSNDGVCEKKYMAKKYTTYARMPYYSEILETECDVTNNNCPLWLVDNLSEISGLEGYWILSSIPSSADYVWIIDYYGNVIDEILQYNDVNGVRPVITVPVNRITQ